MDEHKLQLVEAQPLTLASLLPVVKRRAALLLVPSLAFFLLAALSCIFSTPRYKATAEIQVQNDDGGGLGLESNVLGAAGAPVDGDALSYNMTLQSEAAILKSPMLADTVIQKADLENTPDYFEQRASSPGIAWQKLLFWRKPLEPLRVPLAQAPNRRVAAEKIFLRHLKVLPVAGTRLIDVSYIDRDPARAARVANLATHVLADMAFQERFTSMLEGSSWLTGQLHELRTRTQDAEARAAMLQRGTGLFGDQVSHNVVLERLDSLNQTLTEAESNRILKESIDKIATTASPELISSLSGNSSTGSVASINTSLSLIQGLRAQQAQVRADLAQANVRYGSAYPRVVELNAQLANLDSSIAAETHRLGERAHTDWEIAAREEDAARKAFEKQQQLAAKQNDSVIAYEMARQEANSSRDLYEGVLSKLKQASLLEGLRVNNVSFVSPAGTPAPNQPSSPNIPFRLALGLLGGFLVGACIAVWIELTDDSIYSLSEVERTLGVPLLAVLPSMQAAGRLSLRQRLGLSPGGAWDRERNAALNQPPSMPVLDQRWSVFCEGMRALRSSLQLARSDRPPQVILVTSATANEGKTTLAVNLAASFAQTGARVLLVGADLRRPRLQACSATTSCRGLASALSGSDTILPQEPVATLPTFSLLAGDEAPPFPAELLSSPKMEQFVQDWRSRYDVVVLDSPPALPVTDAALLARHSDAVLMVARHKRTNRQALQRGIEALRKQSGSRSPIGVVINDVAPASGDFYAYFGLEESMYVQAQA